MLTRPRRSLGALVYPFLCGLVFAGAAALAHRAGEAWSPAPDWSPGARAATPATPATLAPPPPASEMLADRAMRSEGCAYRTADGLGYRVIRSRDRAGMPRPQDIVTLRMSGWTHRGQALSMPASPARYRVSNLIPGFVEGLGHMSVGERWMLCIPEELAYKGRPGSPSGMLVFDVELLAIERAPAP